MERAFDIFENGEDREVLRTLLFHGPTPYVSADCPESPGIDRPNILECKSPRTSGGWPMMRF